MFNMKKDISSMHSVLACDGIDEDCYTNFRGKVNCKVRFLNITALHILCYPTS